MPPGTSQSKRDRPNGSRGDRSNIKKTERTTITTTTENMEKAEKVIQEQESPASSIAQMSLTTPDTSTLPSYSFPTSHELRRIGEQITLQKIKAQMIQAAGIPKTNVVVKEDITEWMARLLDLHGFSIERLSNGNFRVSW
ncbi:uncharacterized protein [Branchiostoma lanceolatum]|uniref:uncharacterized protein n=1 Tax=Branchiostoma lanceolatum TaxID=7740 RepID=UPI003456EB82